MQLLQTVVPLMMFAVLEMLVLWQILQVQPRGWVTCLKSIAGGLMVGVVLKLWSRTCKSSKSDAEEKLLNESEGHIECVMTSMRTADLLVFEGQH